MRVEQGKLEGNQKVSGEVELLGMIVGDACIVAGGILHLKGMVVGNLVVEEGGSVVLRGMVTGDTTNSGGQLDIYGTIQGVLRDSSGETIVRDGAVIRGGHIKA